ncbi:Protein CBR-WRM-1 [Caenorhabditis briggsae]|uniref:Armadillo repeat-containing protein wrm-1 n=2 Tax=Caenorhabditis briggsae TaxID=6238 RepID=WRM1_CAEBR|nr:Protein CBR-WRM-1 [Caenorhabditis briggsae]A8X811.1 RecName: Full=Armadillo repeat-containing protein wrm-1; AltName: Full=Worm armadillo protein 1 [Caenorhabditis briggsae]ULT99607.1 hypothetical protein L3Y34_000717 [Caenorhabditis briggsae]UMM22285.1 hypothetical protein L5515_003576 [Caenorhabditis briggsae]CAP28772.3 Protein CBR-WRM-1 [Caenorhabditis briggsae]
MEERGPDIEKYGSQPCTPLSFDPMLPSTSRVATPVRPSSTLSARQAPASPFRAQPQNMEPSISRVHELREGAAVKRSYTNDWMQGNYIPPNPQQQQYQRPPSMIGSTISNMSNLSHMTKFSALSVNTQCGQFDNWIYQSQPALSKVSHSSVENQDPMKRRERMSIPEIVQSLASYEMSDQVAAIRELEPLAKAEALESTYCQADLGKIINALFEVLVPRPQENENVIRKVFEILHRAAVPKHVRMTEKIFHSLNLELMNTNSSKHSFQVPRPYSIYELVIERASRLDTAYDQAAMLLLAQICCKPFFMKYVFSEKEQSAGHRRLHEVVMQFAIKNLQQQETKRKSKGFCVSIIKNLSRRNRSIWSIVYELHVIPIFHDIIKDEYSDEDLLWPTMQALTTFCSIERVGEDFVKLGGAQDLCNLLYHGSTRLLHELLACMQRLSLLQEIGNQDMEESIRRVIQVVGSDDATIAERATGVLRNIGQPNKQNKVIMVRNGVTAHAIAVLRTSMRFQSQLREQQNARTPKNQIDAAKNQILSIYENCLSILNNVTKMGKDDILDSAIQACRMISANPDAAIVLLHFLNAGAPKCRKLAVNVMKRVIENVPAFAEPFVDLPGTTQETLPILLLKRAYESLDEWKKAVVEVMRSEPNTQQFRDAIEKRQDHEDIVWKSVSLLSNLCRNGNPRFFERVKVEMLYTRPTNPFTSLFPEMSDVILYEWLDFILAICGTEWSLQNCLMYHFLKQANITHEYLLHYRRPNPQICDKIKNIIDTGMRQQQQHNQLEQMAMMHAQQQHQQLPM